MTPDLADVPIQLHHSIFYFHVNILSYIAFTLSCLTFSLPISRSNFNSLEFYQIKVSPKPFNFLIATILAIENIWIAGNFGYYIHIISKNCIILLHALIFLAKLQHLRLPTVRIRKNRQA